MQKQFVVPGVILFVLILVVSMIFLASRVRQHSQAVIYPPCSVTLSSPSFDNGGNIPVRYTGRGEDLSPALVFGGEKSGVRSLAVMMDDLDHPIGTFNHWVMWNLPGDLTGLPEGIPHGARATGFTDAVQGKSAYGGKHYYRGPNPPYGTHAYAFRVFYLDTMLDLSENANKADLMNAMTGHILEYGELRGTFGMK